MHRIPSMITISVTFKVRNAYPTLLNLKNISYLFVIQAVSLSLEAVLLTDLGSLVTLVR